MAVATSTRTTAVYPGLGITLEANKPTPVPDDPDVIAELQQIAGVEIETEKEA